VAEDDERDPTGQPLQAIGRAMVVFTLTTPAPDQVARLEQHVRDLAHRLREEHATGFDADQVAGRWEVEVDGVVGPTGMSFGKENRLGALKASHDSLMETFPPENRPPEHEWVVNEQTALIRELAAAEDAEDPEAARRALFERLAREARERFRRFTGKDPDEE
jgi:hypothetical protein